MVAQEILERLSACFYLKEEFVNHSNTYNAVKGAELVLEKAQDAYGQNKFIHAVDLAICIIQEMVELILNSDDSSGTVGGVIEGSFIFINEIILKKLKDESTNRQPPLPMKPVLIESE